MAETSWPKCSRITFAFVTINFIKTFATIEAWIGSTIVNVDLTLSTFPSRKTFTCTFTNAVFWDATIKTFDIIDLALVDFIFTVWLGSTNRTVDTFISTNKVDTCATIVTGVGITFVYILVTILSSPTIFASTFKITGSISTFTMNTWRTRTFVNVVFTILARVPLKNYKPTHQILF